MSSSLLRQYMFKDLKCDLNLSFHFYTLVITRQVKFFKPEENAIPKQTPNPLILRTLSNDAAAMTSVGIPSLTP